MPELPEVESVRQYLLQGPVVFLGRQVQDVLILRDKVVDGNPQLLRQTLLGSACSRIERHGKYLFLCFQQPFSAQSSWLAVHLRMTGRLFLVSGQEPLHRHTRFALVFAQGEKLLFDDPRAFGRIWLVDTPQSVTDRLGPDALSISAEALCACIKGARRQLKPLLLDQSYIAGIGNIYADETLFRAALHPERRSDSLTATELQRLANSLHDVMSEAVRLKGANIDGTFEAGLFPVAVYGRAGLPCMRCGTLLIKKLVGQRGTHFCPACQPHG